MAAGRGAMVNKCTLRVQAALQHLFMGVFKKMVAPDRSSYVFSWLTGDFIMPINQSAKIIFSSTPDEIGRIKGVLTSEWKTMTDLAKQTGLGSGQVNRTVEALRRDKGVDVRSVRTKTRTGIRSLLCVRLAQPLDSEPL